MSKHWCLVAIPGSRHQPHSRMCLPHTLTQAAATNHTVREDCVCLNNLTDDTGSIPGSRHQPHGRRSLCLPNTSMCLTWSGFYPWQPPPTTQPWKTVSAMHHAKAVPALVTCFPVKPWGRPGSRGYIKELTAPTSLFAFGSLPRGGNW